MAIQYPGIIKDMAFAPETFGQPDISNAFINGLQNYVKAQQARYARPAMEMEMQRKQGDLDMQPLLRQLKQAEIDMQPLLRQQKQGELAMQPYRRQLLEAQAQYYKNRPQQMSSIDKIMFQRNLNKQEELDKGLQELKASALDVEGLENLLENTKTGKIPSLKASLGVGGDELGGFNERALRMQAALARAISQRGGAGAAELAGLGKPSGERSNEYNKSVLRAMKTRHINEFNAYKEQYERLGIPFPYKLSDFFKGTQTVRLSKNGKKYDIPIDEALNYINAGGVVE